MHKKHTPPMSLLGKSPFSHKPTKNNVFFTVSGAHAVKISLLKGFLHKCGRAGILCKQVKKAIYVTLANLF